VRIFGIDPGSLCTGFGCVDSDGSRHRLVCCGGIKAPARAAFPDRLRHIHSALVEILAECRPDAVAICHVHTSGLANGAVIPEPEPPARGTPRPPRSWRDYKVI